MKEWFKYQYGFINIDDANLYLNNTGNWSDLVELEEKTNGTKNSGDFRKGQILTLIIACFIFLSVLFVKDYIGDRGTLALCIAIPIGAFFLYRNLKSEVGIAVKIPLTKINNIEINGTTVKLEFNNASNAADTEVLKLVEAKGIELLSKLK